MKQVFRYKEKFAISYCYPAIVFIALAVLSGVFEYGISYKNLKLLEYPNSVFILSACAILFIVYAYYKYKSAKQSELNPNPIEMTETKLSFPKGKETIVVDFADVNELYTKTDEDEGKQVIIYTHSGKNRYEFSEDRFDSPTEFSKFEKLMKEYCTGDRS
jgi:hypothetical protein